MGLLDDIKQATIGTPGPRCRIAQIMLQLSPEDRTDLETALNDPTIYGSAIYRVLVNRGFQVQDHTIHRHRRKDCACGLGR